MMIYYCQATDCSLSSQYSLQESILKVKLSPPFPELQYCVFSYTNCEVRYKITIIMKVHSASTDTLYFCGARSNLILKMIS